MRFVFASAILLFLSASATAYVVTLNPTVEEISLVGKGADALGNGVSLVVPSRCTITAAQTVCPLTGRYTATDAAGIYTLTYQYAGNGAPQLIATTTPTSGEVFSLTVLAGTLTLSLKPDGASAAIFYDLPGQYVLAPARCAATPTCTTSYTGRLQGSVIVGTFSGQIDLTPTIASVSLATAYGASPAIAPGTFVEIYGTNLATTLSRAVGAADYVGAQPPVSLAGTTVMLAGQLAYVQYVSPHQVNVQTPASLPIGVVPIVIATAGGPSLATAVRVNPVEPGILAPPALKIGNVQYAFAIFPDNVTLVLPSDAFPGLLSRPAKPGETIVLYGIGFGPTVTDSATGRSILTTFQATLAGQAMGYSYAGVAPGLLGLYQFNVVIPQISPNDAAPLTISIGGVPGTQTLSLAIGV